MVECARHINLIKIPAENGDDLLESTLAECGHQEKALLQLLVEILQGDHLARLTCANVSYTLLYTLLISLIIVRICNIVA